MPLTINSNVASLNAQTKLSKSTDALRKSFERLSSGLRINKASDDAAGLSVASLLNLDSRVYTQGVRNLSDAVSLYSIAEGGVGELGNIVTRLSELAEQSANGILSHRQRKALESEAQALRSEYNRITTTTSFNGLSLIDGTNAQLSFQGGYSNGGQLSLSLSSLLARALGDGTFSARSTVIAGGSFPLIQDSGDINGDNIPDLLITGWGPVHTAIGNGDGTFRATTNYSLGGGWSGVAGFEDVNGDGRLDIIGYNQNQVYSALGNGNGTFRWFTTSAMATGTGSLLNGAALEDFNGDGRTDIFIGSDAGGFYHLAFGNADGSFTAAIPYAGDRGYNTAIAAGDVDDDGILDVVMMNGSSFLVDLGNGNGTFRRLSLGAGIAAGPVGVLADINNDGRLDAIGYGSSPGEVHISFGNGNGTFRARTSFLIPTSYNGFNPIVDDIDGDGNIDLVISNGTSGAQQLYGNGDGTFRLGSALSASGGKGLLGDFNRDGVNDIAFAGAVFLGNSSSKTSTLEVFSLKTRKEALEAIDLFANVRRRIALESGQIGAQMSRLSSAISVISTQSENYQQSA